MDDLVTPFSGVYRDNNIRARRDGREARDAEDGLRQDRPRHADCRQLDAAHRRRRGGAARLGGVGDQARTAGAGLSHLLAGGCQRLRRRRWPADGADDRRLQDARARRAEAAGLRLLRDPRGVCRAGAGHAESVGRPRLLQGSAWPRRADGFDRPEQAQRTRLVDRHRAIRSRRPARASSPISPSFCPSSTAAGLSPSAPPAAWASPPSSNPRTPPSSTKPRNPSTEAARYATQPANHQQRGARVCHGQGQERQGGAAARGGAGLGARPRRQARPQCLAAPVGRLADAARIECHRPLRDLHRRRRRDRLAAALADARQLHSPLRRQGHRFLRRHADRLRHAAQPRRTFREAERPRRPEARRQALRRSSRRAARSPTTTRASKARSLGDGARPPTTRTTSSSTTTCRTTSTRSSSIRRWSTRAPTTPTGRTTSRRRSATSWK